MRKASPELRPGRGQLSAPSLPFESWRIKTAIAFSDAKRAGAFEKYLKTASGRAFLTKPSFARG
ncbi:MAG TPA: hypothetical protein PLX89_21680 [Verrucomicrobiota bacterium]|nr:hypothetical protein [Verrucomicrobiota bacterium]